MKEAPVLAIVVPCYKEEAVLHETHKRLSQLLDRLTTEGRISPRSYILYVNDGSTDRTWEIIKEFYKNTSYACGLNLAGNVGHQNALMAGLNAVKERCDAAISIDADLQDDVNVIPEMVERYMEGNDIVYGVRRERKTDTFFKRTTALAFYRLMKTMGAKSVYNHADYRLMSSRAIQQLCRFRERNLYLRGLVPLIGYQTACVYYNRDKRFAGESKYPFKKMLNFAIDGITSFSVKPVRMIFWLGCIFLLIALCVTIWTLRAYFLHDTVPGWSSLMISLWLVGGTILVSLGIVGEYIGKIYIEVKDRPRYNEEELLLR
ncbi:glycosyltransferase group 2 family protein [Bacteroides intestinalis CAG:315]|jgi:glycosyltransferase involved in cell wall biosynthesis|uniref:Glycosyltransferase n=1 Tax=Bacteroides intestinalis TaxID=329854 RepID=A0A414LG54_9BACE|nr:glycosyltransferase family 2 protein [Bacteroides intestinalis]RGV55438.1 glycosyltransferase [Bacteroides intestinalis]RHA60421.1 glycosyltransferase [Bacteroides intestinalis]RHE93631.1 glycosyltransferase [Bacteroides intestinalis]CDD98139.1 glycosyltransferase group 2 family protein [Bacteroides intestinalis CAG:315]